MQLSPTFNRVRFVWLCVAACVLVGLCLWLAGCGPSIRWPWESTAPLTGKDGKPVELTGPQELKQLLNQLKWLFIGIGVVSFIASRWVPLISTRHSFGSLILGIAIGVVATFAGPLYWVIVGCLIVGTIGAAWPFLLASITAFRKYVLGHDIQLTGGWGTFATLWKPRSAVMADAAAADRAGDSDGVSSPPPGGGAS